MHRARCITAVLLTATLLMVAGCRIPISEHPLTSEMPGPLDERLIGTWEVDMSPLGAGEGEKQISTVVVRRLKDDPARLEVVGLEGGEEKIADASALVTCHFAMHDYLSFGPLNKGQGQGYAIGQYRLDDADHGSLFLLDSDTMIDAIDRGRIAGEVSRDGVRVTGVAIHAEAEELRRFLHKHSPECFAMATPITARRVK